jgi:hypothetical protein
MKNVTYLNIINRLLTGVNWRQAIWAIWGICANAVITGDLKFVSWFHVRIKTALEIWGFLDGACEDGSFFGMWQDVALPPGSLQRQSLGCFEMLKNNYHTARNHMAEDM